MYLTLPSPAPPPLAAHSRWFRHQGKHHGGREGRQWLFIFHQNYPQATIGFMLTRKQYRMVCKLQTKRPNAMKMKHNHYTSIRFSVSSTSTKPRLKSCDSVGPYEYQIYVTAGPRGPCSLFTCGAETSILCAVGPPSPILPLFSPPSSVCLGGHIWKFPQAQFVMQSRFSSHLKAGVLRMVTRPSLFRLLCTLSYSHRSCSQRAGAALAELGGPRRVNSSPVPWLGFQNWIYISFRF